MSERASRGTKNSNPACSSSQSVSAVNPKAVTEKPRTLNLVESNRRVADPLRRLRGYIRRYVITESLLVLITCLAACFWLSTASPVVRCGMGSTAGQLKRAHRNWVGPWVARAGFEPAISALRGRCPWPLDERAGCGRGALGRMARPLGGCGTRTRT